MVDDPAGGPVPAATGPESWSLDIERAFSAAPERVFTASTDATRDDHVTGWSDCLDRLPAHLATEQARDRAGATDLR